MSKTYILYHANCTDGLGAKYAAWKKFGDQAEYLPMKYDDAIPSFERSSTIYMVDYSRSRKEIIDLRADGQHRVVIIDHHKTAKEELEGLGDVVFDMNKSGAVLAWEYFHPTVPVPKLLEFIQDRDLWNWKMQGTREILKALEMRDKDWDIAKWDGIQEEMNEDLNGFFGKGATISLWEDIRIERATKKENIHFFEYLFKDSEGKVKVFKVGMLNSTILPSEMGAKICETYPVDFSITYYLDSNNKVNLSFRSKKGSNVDVSAIAKDLGGGGHPAASGAVISIHQLVGLFLSAPKSNYDITPSTSH